MKLIVLKNNVPISEVTVETSDLSETYEIFVGRSEDCHVQIDDPLISRHHFVLKNENSSWYCEKLTQLGVITLNGSLVGKNPLKAGDEIKTGAYSVVVAELPKVAAHESPTPEPQYSEPVASVYEEPSATVIMPPPQALEPAPAPVAEKGPVLDESLESMTLDESPLSDSVEEEVVSQERISDDLGDLDTFSNEVQSEEINFSDEKIEVKSEENNSGFNVDLTENQDFSDGGQIDGENNYQVATTEDSNESTRFFKAFVNYQLTLFGEHAPYDRFQIDQDEIFIGRDDKKCQIVLNDPEVSSVHAVLKKNLTEITLEDLNSSNGTILNGERINKATLSTGDEFVIGGTSFTLEVRSDLLETESERLMPVEQGQEVEVEEVIEEEITADNTEINFNNDLPVEKSPLKRMWKDPKQRKKLIIAICAIAAIFLLFDDEQQSSESKPVVAKEAKKTGVSKAGPKLSKELENRRNVAYELGVNYFEQRKYFEAENQFRTVVDIDPNYKKVQSYLEQTREALKRLAELEAQKRAEEERIKLKKVIEELLVKARDAVQEKKVQVAESFFAQIIEKDPDNIEVSQLKLELEAWQKEEERKALEKAAKEAARKKMVDAITPGKTYYLKKEWYKAILKLEDFLRQKGMDEDLVKEASDMLSDSKNQLSTELGPLLGKARSLKEGQDYRSAYEAFLEILKIEPTNTEALNEVDDIKSQLDARSKKIYREAIIAESLSLFGDAKEKFQEVQQISPTDSEYYKKASEKLKNYLE